MPLDVCVFAHNPRKEIFQLVLYALARQTLARDRFRVWVIDNASTPPISASQLESLAQGQVRFEIVREERVGLIFARKRACTQTTSDWVVFVDDDNELADNYLEKAVEVISSNPCLGCFGGKLLLPEHTRVPGWMGPMLKFLAIKDAGEAPIAKCSNEWGDWEPCGAGAVVKRSVLNWYLKKMEEISDCSRLDRKGRWGLFSGGDSLIMRGAFFLNLESAYQPALKLTHHLNPKRFTFSYMLRLFYAYGRSHVLLERILGNNVPRCTRETRRYLLKQIPRTRERACMLALEWGHYFESRQPSRDVPGAIKKG